MASIFFTVRDQVFTIAINGLKPSTVHSCYFERNKVDASKIKPKNGQLGDPLITDENGSITFDFYYSSGLGDQATTVNYAQQQVANLGGTKEIVVTDLTSATLSAGYDQIVSSLYVGQISISVYIPPENEWAQDVVYVAPQYVESGPI